MAAHLFNESGQMQEVDIPDIFDVLEGLVCPKVIFLQAPEFSGKTSKAKELQKRP